MVTVIAHRGGKGPAVENTLAAFRHGLAEGADMVELDCKLSRDGTVVVLHDQTLARHWGLDRGVVDLDWPAISRLRRGGDGVPRLSDVLAEVAAPLMVDVPSAQVVEACVKVADEAGATDRCIFAGNLGALRHLRRLHPDARIALSWEHRRPPAPDLLRSLRPELFNPHWPLVSAKLVDQFHRRGIGVSVWTVNDQWAMRWVFRAGVDVVITDRVGRLLRLVGRRS